MTHLRNVYKTCVQTLVMQPEYMSHNLMNHRRASRNSAKKQPVNVNEQRLTSSIPTGLFFSFKLSDFYERKDDVARNHTTKLPIVVSMNWCFMIYMFVSLIKSFAVGQITSPLDLVVLWVFELKFLSNQYFENFWEHSSKKAKSWSHKNIKR